MAVDDILNQLQLLIKGAAPQLIELSDQPSELVPFVPGERYTAKVQAEIANGRFLVVIQDQKLDLNLPRSTQAGQNIELRFVAGEPRLTFVLAEAATPAATTPAVSLNDSARYLSSLLDRVKDIANQQTATPGRATALQAAEKPLLTGAPNSVAEFAGALKQAIAQSGLFYESHQAQWVAGERPLAELLREPQGKLAEPRAALAAQISSANTAQDAPKVTANLSAALTAKAETLLTSATLATPAREANAAVHPQTAPIVQQQIDVLDTRQMVWQGQVWTGQEMRWQIEERTPRGEEETAAREWQTRLDLRLPHLGELSAVLKISPQGAISIDLRAHEPAAARTLESAAPLLSLGMTRAGLSLSGMTVSSDG